MLESDFQTKPIRTALICDTKGDTRLSFPGPVSTLRLLAAARGLDHADWISDLFFLSGGALDRFRSEEVEHTFLLQSSSGKGFLVIKG